MTFYSFLNSLLGDVLLVSNGKALTGAYFVGQKNFPDINITRWVNTPDLEVFAKTKAQLAEYFKGERKHFDIEYQLQGNTLQNKVWAALIQIPSGETISYKNIANIINEPKSIRHVANSVGNNPIIIIVPCHRVIGSNGKLTGYSAGLDTKKKLLELEKQYYKDKEQYTADFHDTRLNANFMWAYQM